MKKNPLDWGVDTAPFEPELNFQRQRIGIFTSDRRHGGHARCPHPSTGQNVERRQIFCSPSIYRKANDQK